MSRILWAAVNFVQGVFLAVWTMGCISAALVVHTIARRSAAPLVMARRLWAPGVLAAGGVRVRASGIDEIDWSRPWLIACNHQSLLDIPALFRGLPTPLAFVAKSELGAVPFLGAYMRAMGMLFVDRRRGRAALGIPAQARPLFERGWSLVVFPGGTRRDEGERQRFRSGAFAAALDNGVAVLPVAVIGSGARLPARTWSLRPGVIELAVGSPIPTAGASRAELANRAEEAVEALLGQASAAS